MRDPYALHVAFDDVEDFTVLGGASHGYDRDDVLEALRAWVEAAKQEHAHSVVGADVRLDDPESYAAFRTERALPYIQKLDERLSALEATVADHASDHHAHGRVARLEAALRQHMADDHGAAVTALGADIARATTGGTSIPLPCCKGGAIECWLDGDQIMCTVKFMAPDGVRMATASSPAQDAVDAVVRAAYAGPAYEDVTIVGGSMAACIGADKLVTDVCCAIVGYLENPKKSKLRDFSVAGNRYLHGCDVLIACGGAT